MGRLTDRTRRNFLESTIAGIVPALPIAVTNAAFGQAPPKLPRKAGTPSGSRVPIDTNPVIVGDDAITFRKHTLDLGCSEAVTVVDMNRDGKLDIVSGENWYEQVPSEPRRGPRFIKHKFRDLPYTKYYLEDLSDLAVDVNGNGYPDIVSCSYWTKPLTWWENPGDSGRSWREHIIEPASPVEFVFLVDILNTGKPLQLLPQFGDPQSPLAWYELAEKGARDPWIKHEISPNSFGHGIGAGDVNGDGRTDIITPKGWFEAPPDPRAGKWAWHPEYDLGTSAGFIYAYDINGDGRSDLITTAAHDYGFFWLEQGTNHQWTKHMIDETWSQGHAMTMTVLDGDGRPDFLTGNRYMAHDTDPGAREPLGVYWYQFLKGDDGKVVSVKHVIDYSTRTGAGMQIPVAAHLGFVAGGKSGLFFFENATLRQGTTIP